MIVPDIKYNYEMDSLRVPNNDIYYSSSSTYTSFSGINLKKFDDIKDSNFKAMTLEDEERTYEHTITNDSNKIIESSQENNSNEEEYKNEHENIIEKYNLESLVNTSISGMICNKKHTYTLVDLIGNGSFAAVYIGRREDDKCFAIKCIPKEDLNEDQLSNQLLEAETLIDLGSHPNILGLHHIIDDEKYLFLVLDLCDIDLYDVLTRDYCEIEKNEYGGLAEDDVRYIFNKISNAVLFCHDHSVYHRDLKPENILLRFNDPDRCVRKYDVKLTDFGLCTRSDFSEAFGCGSLRYIPPECINDNVAAEFIEQNSISFTEWEGHDVFDNDNKYKQIKEIGYSAKANDAWAMGIILINLLFGRNPWYSASMDDECFLTYVNDDSDFLRKKFGFTEQFNQYIKKVFSFKPCDRYSLREMVEKFNEIDIYFDKDYNSQTNSNKSTARNEGKKDIQDQETFETEMETEEDEDFFFNHSRIGKRKDETFETEEVNENKNAMNEYTKQFSSYSMDWTLNCKNSIEGSYRSLLSYRCNQQYGKQPIQKANEEKTKKEENNSILNGDGNYECKSNDNEENELIKKKYNGNKNGDFWENQDLTEYNKFFRHEIIPKCEDNIWGSSHNRVLLTDHHNNNHNDKENDNYWSLTNIVNNNNKIDNNNYQNKEKSILNSTIPNWEYNNNYKTSKKEEKIMFSSEQENWKNKVFNGIEKDKAFVASWNNNGNEKINTTTTNKVSDTFNTVKVNKNSDENCWKRKENSILNCKINHWNNEQKNNNNIYGKLINDQRNNILINSNINNNGKNLFERKGWYNNNYNNGNNNTFERKGWLNNNNNNNFISTNTTNNNIHHNRYDKKYIPNRVPPGLTLTQQYNVKNERINDLYSNRKFSGNKIIGENMLYHPITLMNNSNALQYDLGNNQLNNNNINNNNYNILNSTNRNYYMNKYGYNYNQYQYQYQQQTNAQTNNNLYINRQPQQLQQSQPQLYHYQYQTLPPQYQYYYKQQQQQQQQYQYQNTQQQQQQNHYNESQCPLVYGNRVKDYYYKNYGSTYYNYGQLSSLCNKNNKNELYSSSQTTYSINNSNINSPSQYLSYSYQNINENSNNKNNYTNNYVKYNYYDRIVPCYYSNNNYNIINTTPINRNNIQDNQKMLNNTSTMNILNHYSDQFSDSNNANNLFKNYQKLNNNTLYNNNYQKQQQGINENENISEVKMEVNNYYINNNNNKNEKSNKNMLMEPIGRNINSESINNKMFDEPINHNEEITKAILEKQINKSSKDITYPNKYDDSLFTKENKAIGGFYDVDSTFIIKEKKASNNGNNEINYSETTTIIQKEENLLEEGLIITEKKSNKKVSIKRSSSWGQIFSNMNYKNDEYMMMEDEIKSFSTASYVVNEKVLSINDESQEEKEPMDKKYTSTVNSINERINNEGKGNENIQEEQELQEEEMELKKEENKLLEVKTEQKEQKQKLQEEEMKMELMKQEQILNEVETEQKHQEEIVELKEQGQIIEIEQKEQEQEVKVEQKEKKEKENNNNSEMINYNIEMNNEITKNKQKFQKILILIKNIKMINNSSSKKLSLLDHISNTNIDKLFLQAQLQPQTNNNKKINNIIQLINELIKIKYIEQQYKINKKFQINMNIKQRKINKKNYNSINMKKYKNINKQYYVNHNNIKNISRKIKYQNRIKNNNNKVSKKIVSKNKKVDHLKSISRIRHFKSSNNRISQLQQITNYTNTTDVKQKNLNSGILNKINKNTQNNENINLENQSILQINNNSRNNNTTIRYIADYLKKIINNYDIFLNRKNIINLLLDQKNKTINKSIYSININKKTNKSNKNNSNSNINNNIINTSATIMLISICGSEKLYYIYVSITLNYFHLLIQNLKKVNKKITNITKNVKYYFTFFVINFMFMYCLSSAYYLYMINRSIHQYITSDLYNKMNSIQPFITTTTSLATFSILRYQQQMNSINEEKEKRYIKKRLDLETSFINNEKSLILNESLQNKSKVEYMNENVKEENNNIQKYKDNEIKNENIIYQPVFLFNISNRLISNLFEKRINEVSLKNQNEMKIMIQLTLLSKSNETTDSMIRFEKPQQFITENKENKEPLHCCCNDNKNPKINEFISSKETTLLSSQQQNLQLLKSTSTSTSPLTLTLTSKFTTTPPPPLEIFQSPQFPSNSKLLNNENESSTTTKEYKVKILENYHNSWSKDNDDDLVEIKTETTTKEDQNSKSNKKEKEYQIKKSNKTQEKKKSSNNNNINKNQNTALLSFSESSHPFTTTTYSSSTTTTLSALLKENNNENIVRDSSFLQSITDIFTKLKNLIYN